MRRDELNDLAAFAAVADEGSFTRAAATLGMSQSALSHALRGLEERLNVRLLSRTTRSVSATAAGETLLRSFRPALADIASGLTAIGAIGATVSCPIRLTGRKNAIAALILPVLPAFLAANPNVSVELVADDDVTDFVANRFDAGIRVGNFVEKDMVAVCIGPDMKRAVVGAPAYFADNPPPATPHDLVAHSCIAHRLARSGDPRTWEFEENGRPLEVRVDGPLVFNDGDLVRAAALAGMGMAYVYEGDVEDDIGSGCLIRTLADWCPPLPGYHLHHPSGRRTPPALTALIAAIRSGAGEP